MGGPHCGLWMVVLDAMTETSGNSLTGFLPHVIFHVLQFSQFMPPDIYKSWPYCKVLPNNIPEFPSVHVLIIL